MNRLELEDALYSKGICICKQASRCRRWKQERNKVQDILEILSIYDTDATM